MKVRKRSLKLEMDCHHLESKHRIWGRSKHLSIPVAVRRDSVRRLAGFPLGFAVAKLTALFCHWRILLKEDAVVADGESKAVLIPGIHEEAYLTRVIIRDVPAAGKHQVVFFRNGSYTCEDLLTTMEQLGILVGKPEPAQDVVAQL
jgi:hypothetical protein